MIAADRDLHSLPLTEERMQVTIDGQSASTTLTQVYQHDQPNQIEGHYRLRPGSGAHVDGFAYWNGEAKIVGEVFERETARRVYDNVTRRKRDPGLLEEDGEGAFAFKVFPIAPHEKKRVELKWTKWLDRHAQTVRFRAPITRPDAEIVIDLNAPAKNLRSPSHRFRVDRSAAGIRLRAEGTKEAGEVVLEWDVDEGDWTPDVYVQPGYGVEEGWFTLSLAAPKLPASAVAAKDVTIVIDRSGSMEGDKMRHAKTAAAQVVRLLHEQDRVNVISFSDEVDPLSRAPEPATADVRTRAIGFIDRLHAGGGTDIALALKTAISSQAPTRDRPHVVVFLTDGQSDADTAVKAAGTDVNDIRLFTLGLGEDVNRTLLSRLAAIKRGRFVYIESAQAIEGEVGRLASQIANPLLVDVSVDIEGPQPVRIYPRTLPDLFAEDELVVSGRLRGTGVAKFIVRGKLGGKPVQFTRTIDVAHAGKRPWVGAMWAQSRVAHLLEEISLGGTGAELKTEVIDLALAYNFVTPYTAFLAVPESELGNMRSTVEAARAHKKQIHADNPDLDVLDKDKPDDQIARSTRRRPYVDGRGTKKGIDADSDAAPEMDKKSVKKDVADRDDDEDARPKRHKRHAAKADASDGGDDNMSAKPSDMAPTNQAEPMTVNGKRSGCAGCASGGATPGSLLVAFACIALLRRRRR